MIHDIFPFLIIIVSITIFILKEISKGKENEKKKELEKKENIEREKRERVEELKRVKERERKERVRKVEKEKWLEIERRREIKRKKDELRKQEENRLERERIRTSLKPLTPRIKEKKSGVKYSALLKYYPLKYNTPEISDLDVKNRKHVWNFKDGKETKLYSYILSRALKHMYPEDVLKNKILLPIPASTNYKTKRRYEGLIKQISYLTGIQNGLPFIENTLDVEAKHLNEGYSSLIPTLFLDDNKLRGKEIILLDDIITRGNNLLQLTERLKKESRVKSVEGLFLSKTTHLNNY